MAPIASQRYESIQDLRNDLRSWLDHQPVTVGPNSLKYKLGKYIKRNKAKSWMAAIALLSLAGVFMSTAINLAQTRKAKSRVDKAYTELKTTHEFYESILIDPHPYKMGPEVRYLEVIEEAERKLERAAGNQPNLEINVRTRLGDTYFTMGNYQTAFRHYDRASLLAAQMGKGNQEILADVMQRKARTVRELGELDEAESLFQQALSLLSERGMASTAFLQARVGLASVFLEKNQPQVALNYCEQESQQLLTILGPADRATHQAFNTLASVRMNLEQWQQAERLLRQTIQWQSQSIGADHLETMITNQNLGNLLVNQGDEKKAEQHFRTVYARRLTLLGEEHIFTQRSHYGLGLALKNQGHHEEAKAIFETLFRLQQHLPQGSGDFRRTIIALADTYRRLGKIDESVALLEELYRQSQGKDKNNPGFLKLMNNLGYYLNRQERHDEALILLLEVLALKRKVLKPNHSSTLQTMDTLAEVYLSMGAPDEAGALFYGALVLAEKHHSANWRLIAMLESHYGLALKDAGDLEAAECFLKAAFPRQRGEERERAAQALLEIYHAWNRPDLAQPFQ